MLISTDAIGKYHNYLYGAGVDIFPYDYLSEDTEKERQRMGVAEIPMHSCFFSLHRGRQESCFGRRSKKGGKNTKVKLLHSPHYRENILNLLSDCFQRFNQNPGSKIACLLDFIIYQGQGKGIFNAHWYDEQVYLDFEFLALPAPKEYIKVISERYYDYRTVKKRRRKS